jgi:hypothetical protein
MKRNVLVLGVTAGLLVACTEEIVSPGGSVSERPQSSSLAIQTKSSADAAQRLARALAAAMATPQIRATVLRSMRASQVTEHKLVWQEFVRTAPGRALVAAAARSAGATPAELEAISLRLPALDFYVPAREHRRTWKGGADLLVAATLTEQAPTVAYSSNGTSVPLDLRNRAPRQALFVLQPAERKSVRIRIQARRDGPTIQDADDGDASGTLVLLEPGKDPVVLPLRDGIRPMEECNPEQGSCGGGGTGGGWTPVPDVTRIPSITTFDVCDNNNCWEGNEFEFRSKYYLANGSLAASAVYRREGVHPHTTVSTNNAVLINKRIRENTAETIRVTLIETDGWPNPDDNYGTSTIRDNPTAPSSPQNLRYYDFGGTTTTPIVGVVATVMWQLKF